ncbi:MAG TPA: phasin family protein [Thermohalobaculum sp.]|nr:phasin family protein [Thermohalobaculum sp.]
MNTESFPFAFDANKVKEMFAIAKLPVVDTEAVIAAQQKNMDAFVAANKVVFAGYQDVVKRQMALIEAAVAQAKDGFSELQGQPLTVEQASANVEAMKVAFEKAAADTKELTELAHKANTGAFEIVKARFEEAVGEFKAAAEKAAA